jgi:lycopene cyclase CruA
MKQILYIEVPTPDIAAVRDWLQQRFAPTLQPSCFEKLITPDGCRLKVNRNPHPATQVSENLEPLSEELSIFTWSVQRTTYLKVFRWSDQPLAQEKQLLEQLTKELRSQFPQRYPELPQLDLSQQSIFEALAPHYPKTAKYFRAIPNGEADLTRVYWWEQRWREGVRNPQDPRRVIFKTEERSPEQRIAIAAAPQSYDLIYLGGALGVIHAAVMARLGYRVLLVERLPFGRMNREWNISRDEFQTLIDLELLTPAEFEAVIAREYRDGFSKFFDANNPPQAKAPVLHTPTVLNVGIDAEKLLRLCGYGQQVGKFGMKPSLCRQRAVQIG